MTQELNRTPTHVRTSLEFYIGPIEAAEFLGWNIQTTLFFAAMGIIPAHRLRHESQTAWRFKVSELTAWAMQHRFHDGPKGSRQLASTEVEDSLSLAANSLARPASIEK